MLLVEPYRTFRIGGKDYYVVFFDFDECRNPETEELSPQVKVWMEGMNTYFEVSPSGKGVRGIGFAEKKPGSRSRFKIGGQVVEVYGGNHGGRHLITFTGVPLLDRPINTVQKWIDENVPVDELAPDDEAIKPEPLDASDEEVMQIMLRSKDAPLLKRFMNGDETLWKGKDSEYESRSHADQGFFRLLAFYTRKDSERMERIALSSKMRRRKWAYGAYLPKTIEKGIKYCPDVYDPTISSSGEERQKRTHKRLIELVLLGGMKNLYKLVELFGMRPNNFKGRVLKPLIDVGLLEYEEGENGVRLIEDFEEALHKVFVASGGEEALGQARERFAADRKAYAEKPEEYEEVHDPETVFSDPHEVVLGRLGLTMEDWDEMGAWQRKQLYWSWDYWFAATA